MSTVKSTFVIPDFGPNQTMIDPNTGMAQGYASSPLAGLLASASDKPLKERQVATTRPTAYDDILKTRNSILGFSKELDDAMKIKESTGYSLANALANIPQQQGYGSWLSDFARAFGGGMTNAANNYVDRAKAKFTNDLNLAKAGLDFDKALGNTVTTDYEYSAPGTGAQSLMASLLLGNL